MAHGVAHDPETRAKVVAEIISGCSPTDVALRYGIPKQTVHEWGRKARTAFVQTVRPYERTREEIANLVYDTLVETLGTYRAQLRIAADPEWIKTQTSGDLTNLAGMLLDRALRLLAGFRVSDSEDPAGGQPALESPAGSADAGAGVPG